MYFMVTTVVNNNDNIWWNEIPGNQMQDRKPDL